MDRMLHQLIVNLAEATRDLPATPAADVVRTRAIEVIRHLETQRLISPGSWDLGAR